MNYLHGLNYGPDQQGADCGKIDEGIALIREAILEIEKLEGKESPFL